MIISLCGDLEDKKLVIKELKDVYKDKLLICDYFQICFKNVIENEPFPRKELSPREALAVCTPPAPKPSARTPGS